MYIAPTKGLIIAEPWISKILDGEKTWEMRSKKTTVRGKIALIKKGSGLIVGEANINRVLPAKSIDELRASSDRHCIPEEMFTAPGFKWNTPWVLTDVFIYDEPIPYNHPRGAVTWVNLPAAA